MELDHLRRELLKLAEEATYAAVGFGVIGLQRAQVRRRQLEDLAPEALRELGSSAPGVARLVGSAVSAAACLAAGAGRELADAVSRRLRDEEG